MSAASSSMSANIIMPAAKGAKPAASRDVYTYPALPPPSENTLRLGLVGFFIEQKPTDRVADVAQAVADVVRMGGNYVLVSGNNAKPGGPYAEEIAKELAKDPLTKGIPVHIDDTCEDGGKRWDSYWGVISVSRFFRRE